MHIGAIASMIFIKQPERQSPAYGTESAAMAYGGF